MQTLLKRFVIFILPNFQPSALPHLGLYYKPYVNAKIVYVY